MPQSKNVCQFNIFRTTTTSSSSATVLSTQDPIPSATTDEELNALLDQIEEQIGMDLELTQDLLDILNEEQKPTEVF